MTSSRGSRSEANPGAFVSALTLHRPSPIGPTSPGLDAPKCRFLEERAILMGPGWFEEHTSDCGDEREVDDVEPETASRAALDVTVPRSRRIEYNIERFERLLVIVDHGDDPIALEADA